MTSHKFHEKMEIKYQGMCGIVGFVCEQYIVLRLPPPKGGSSPGLLIFPENYDQVICLKDSEK